MIGRIVALSRLPSRMIFPGLTTQGADFAVIRPERGATIEVVSTERGEQVAVLYGGALSDSGQPLADAEQRPSLLYFYGNGMYLGVALEMFDYFRRIGLNVAITEYPGYGMSSGTASEAACYRAARAAYRYLTETQHVSPSAIVIAGTSLGAAVAIDLATRVESAGVVCFSAFTSLAEVAVRVLPRWIPPMITVLALKHTFDNLRKISTLNHPIFISHGKADSLTPFEMAERLVHSAHGEVEFVPVEGAGHNDLIWVGGERLREGLRAFCHRIAFGDGPSSARPIVGSSGNPLYS